MHMLVGLFYGGSTAKGWVATIGSKPGISEYVYANTSWFYFKNLRYMPFSLWDMLSLMNLGHGSLLEPRLISKSSSCAVWPPSSNVGGAWVGSTVSLSSLVWLPFSSSFGDSGKFFGDTTVIISPWHQHPKIFRSLGIFVPEYKALLCSGLSMASNGGILPWSFIWRKFFSTPLRIFLAQRNIHLLISRRSCLVLIHLYVFCTCPYLLRHGTWSVSLIPFLGSFEAMIYVHHSHSRGVIRQVIDKWMSDGNHYRNIRIVSLPFPFCLIKSGFSMIGLNSREGVVIRHYSPFCPL